MRISQLTTTVARMAKRLDCLGLGLFYSAKYFAIMVYLRKLSYWPPLNLSSVGPFHFINKWSYWWPKYPIVDQKNHVNAPSFRQYSHSKRKKTMVILISAHCDVANVVGSPKVCKRPSEAQSTARAVEMSVTNNKLFVSSSQTLIKYM